MAPTTQTPRPHRLTATTAEAPARWASYLVNGDASGISRTDRAEADRWARSVQGAIVSCGEEYTARWDGLIDTLTDYDVLIVEEN